MKGMGRASMEYKVSPGPSLGHLEQPSARLPFARQLLGPTAASGPVLWNLGSKASLMEKDACHH